MFVSWLISGVDLLTTLLFLLVLTHVIISYFMSPFHPFRMWVNRIVEPMLNPIRSVVPLVGMFDFSPVILLLLIQLLGFVLKQILYIFI